MKKTTDNYRHIKAVARRNFFLIAAIFGLAAAGLAVNIWQLDTMAHAKDLGSGTLSVALRNRLHDDLLVIQTLKKEQSTAGDQQLTPGDIEASTSQIQISLAQGDYRLAREELHVLDAQLERWHAALDETRSNQQAAAKAANQSAPAGAPEKGAITAPILIYHYTPGNFEAQLQSLVAKHYTTISLDELAAGIADPTTLPAKPAVITFDDGFANQEAAVGLLKKYQMKATFYIIVGGPGSDYCIGAERTNLSCGDAYLTWDQIRAIDADPLFTIAAHTIDHIALAGQPVDSQRHQIADSKALIEAQVGHTVHHFAYPYGSFNATSVALVRSAGFTTAVSTLSGIVQTPSTIYSLRRARSALTLP